MSRPLKKPQVPEKELEVQFFIPDHAGTPLFLANAKGEILWEALPDDWKATQEVELVKLLVSEYGVRQFIRFQGQWADEETGFYYNRHRYYDPAMGRYITQDPIGIRGGMNLYAYAGGDPVNYVDPEGLFIPALLALFAVVDVLVVLDVLAVIAGAAAIACLASNKETLDKQDVLPIIGLVPIVGEPADMLDGYFYLREGDPLNAGLSFSSVVPVAGIAGGIKRLNKPPKGVAKGTGSGGNKGGSIENVKSGDTPPKPNSTIKAAGPTVVYRNGYKYTIDELGRTTRIEGKLVSNPAQGRNPSAQLKAGGEYRLPTDEGGHYVGRRFDGPLDELNHFAQDMNLNRGAYKSLENNWDRALKQGKTVDIDIQVKYPDNSLRPDKLDIVYKIDDTLNRMSFKNAPGGK
jgi:RHS repeat-associated protein